MIDYQEINKKLDSIEQDIEAFISQLNITSFEDVLHVYDDHELCIIDQDGKYVSEIPKEVDESDSRVARIKRSIWMKSHSYGLHVRRMLAVKVPSTLRKLQHRARNATLYSIKRHIDKNYSKLAPMEKAAIDQVVKRREHMVNAISNKLVQKIASFEHNRIAHFK